MERWKREPGKSILWFDDAFYAGPVPGQPGPGRVHGSPPPRLPNLEKKSASKFSGCRFPGSGGTIRISTPAASAVQLADSADYYERVLGQPDLIDEYGASLLNADSLFAGKTGNYKAIYFPDYLSVVIPGRWRRKVICGTGEKKKTCCPSVDDHIAGIGGCVDRYQRKLFSGPQCFPVATGAGARRLPISFPWNIVHSRGKTEKAAPSMDGPAADLQFGMSPDSVEKFGIDQAKALA